MKTINFLHTGFGQWKVSTIHRNKEISIHYTCAPVVDLIKSRERGYKTAIKELRSLIINNNK
jgi:hypothetical protein